MIRNSSNLFKVGIGVPRFVGWGGSDSEEIVDRGDEAVLGREFSIALFFPLLMMI